MEALAELSAEHNDIVFEKPYFSADVMADKKRLLQLIENIINNARKYAKTEINARLEMEDGCVRLCLRDHGNGIPDEDMPFIFEKFYRGHNSGDEQGSGLGLYIVKYIADQMNGKVSLRNLKDGLEVTLELPCAD
jgi:signal transduction histidine kinase